MEEWINRTLDFTECKYVHDLHEMIKTELELPEWYGRNLDALWDSITGIMDTPAYITIRGSRKVPQSIEKTMTKIIEVFRRADIMYDFVRVQVID